MSLEIETAEPRVGGAFGRRRVLRLLGALMALPVVGRKTAAAAGPRPGTAAGPRHVVRHGWVLRADEIDEVLGR
jgi:hypothetical protein